MQPNRLNGREEHGWYIEGREQPVQLGAADLSICRCAPLSLQTLSTSTDGASRSVTRRDLSIAVDASFVSPAYLDERLPVNVDVRNDDEVDVELFLVIFLQPGEDGSREFLSNSRRLHD